MMDLSRRGIKHETKTKSLKEEALEHLASIDLLELCKEAKVERCRAARDISSCGRYESYTKKWLFQDKEDDVRRLYSLFDVAIENNLVSLVCHYVTDVCMDESAVSSDPILAFLLDEVVVKDWCKRTFENIIEDLRGIYNLRIEEMQKKKGIFLKYISQLTGISCVIDVLESSFKATLSPQLRDLHYLSENILKAKQHLEVMTWCVRHQFLENIHSRYSNSALWHSVVRERKSSATKRSWPTFSCSSAESVGQDGSTLFIEDALSNLGLDEGHVEGTGEEIGIACLEKSGGYPSLFSSKIDGMAGCYPFENLQAAADILFLHGSSDMVVAKRAIFLYYLFDRHWTVPEAEWRHIINDFAATFGITKHSLLESFTFYLLDDESEQALQEACHLLPNIACTTTHPKIAQVLLERQKPDASLMVLRCSGRDGLCGYANTENGGAQLVSLYEALTAVRVRVECGLLTEAFMYQRTHCTKVREEKRKHGSTLAFSDDLKHGYKWMEQMEVLVTEICCLCIRRNLIDRMIELPWNSDEEKFLHKCLFDNASEDPSTASGSLLVVFYLQRYRYIEAYQVDHKLQSLEDDIISRTTNEEMVSRIRSISESRARLIDKCIELLPEVQQQKLKTGNLPDYSLPNEVKSPAKADFSGVVQPNATSLPVPSLINSSVVFGMNLTRPSKRTSPSDTPKKSHLDLNLNNYRAPSILHGRLLASVKGPSILGQMDAPSLDRFSHKRHNWDNLTSHSISTKEPSNHFGITPEFQSDNAPIALGTPLKELNRSTARALQNNQPVNPFFRTEKSASRIEPNGSIHQVENARTRVQTPTANDHDEEMATSSSNIFSRYLTHDSSQAVSGKQIMGDGPLSTEQSDEAMDFSWSFSKRETPVRDLNVNGGLRWRSDETSEDEDDSSPSRLMGGASVATPARGTRSRIQRR
ncbi:hypothetical protein MRB53_001910 [Persea americana]|uniref:Uncharacterized protein n=1 Tax=Persea americana TaxID=3435 RepID=A0ACC2MVC6_PERAE|nr:hypothetical protein MRB53_001910 [Persea americana]